MPEGEPPTGSGDAGGQGGQPPAPSAAKFTQEDVDRFNAETRRKAEEASAKRILEALGIEDVEKGKEIIASAKAVDDASKSELQKAQEELERLRAENATVSGRARESLVRTELKLALRDAGINPQRLDQALKLAPAGDVKVTDDGAIAGLEDAVKAVREASPEWFGAPGKAFSAPDASGGNGQSDGFKWQDASVEERAAELRKHGISPSVRRR